MLLNTFNLAEDSVSLDNILEVMDQLNTTYPQQFAELSGRLENCSLESELDTVRSSFFLQQHTKTFLKTVLKLTSRWASCTIISLTNCNLQL